MYKINFKIEKPPITDYREISRKEIPTNSILNGDLVHYITEKEYQILHPIDYESIETPYLYKRPIKRDESN